MTATRQETDVQRVASLERKTIAGFLGRFGLMPVWVPDANPIPGSYWGDSEAGIVGLHVYLRSDTPVHSMLHETCHVLCMTPERRAHLECDAGGDDLEESAVCYLQICLADCLPGVGARRLMQDMDTWGYSFRLGNSEAWFLHDAEDARRWLRDCGLIGVDGSPTFRMRGDA